jgi:hypothetical protein
MLSLGWSRRAHAGVQTKGARYLPTGAKSAAHHDPMHIVPPLSTRLLYFDSHRNSLSTLTMQPNQSTSGSKVLLMGAGDVRTTAKNCDGWLGRQTPRAVLPERGRALVFVGAPLRPLRATAAI